MAEKPSRRTTTFWVRLLFPNGVASDVWPVKFLSTDEENDGNGASIHNLKLQILRDIEDYLLLPSNSRTAAPWMMIGIPCDAGRGEEESKEVNVLAGSLLLSDLPEGAGQPEMPFHVKLLLLNDNLQNGNAAARVGHFPDVCSGWGPSLPREWSLAWTFPPTGQQEEEWEVKKTVQGGALAAERQKYAQGDKGEQDDDPVIGDRLKKRRPTLFEQGIAGADEPEHIRNAKDLSELYPGGKVPRGGSNTVDAKVVRKILLCVLAMVLFFSAMTFLLEKLPRWTAAAIQLHGSKDSNRSCNS
eukprot:TRINITY_DN2211_c0_g1_i1.p1 TRINITY_DN2211_c0_g1~~TRINITY_DN2211_c0_g1_i1.p1  ORF type:complete len:327 (-),score=64.85 TRINITY_DN2211_c0_g1_i1:146-1045(-)